MIERPRRAVTRFFIPLIDVLILLFCIFLLMPFMDKPGSAEPGKTPEEKKEMTPEEMKKEIAGLRLELSKALKDIKQLQEERTNPAEKVVPFILEIDPANGHLLYHSGGKARRVSSQRDAEEVISQHNRRIGIGREPLFIFMYPRQSSIWPTGPQMAEYKSWFKDVAIQENDPFRSER